MDETWTIRELAEHAASALAADGAAQVSGRVRDLPNERLIRWYTTIGLVDPPLARRGRTALYGPRHLLQLVAVKRRQAAGRSIAEIQIELSAAPDETLVQIAGIPAAGTPAPLPQQDDPAANTDLDTVETAPAAAGEGEGVSGRADFWNTRPDVSYTDAAVADDYGKPLLPVVHGVRLTPGLTLLLDGPPLDGDDLAAIEAAARPLLGELRRRGLLTPAESTAESPASSPADHSRRFQ